MPYVGDLSKIVSRRQPEEYRGTVEEDKACDELIDAMMIADCDFNSFDISVPAMSANHNMVAHFATDPKSEKDETSKGGLPDETIRKVAQAKPLCEHDVPKIVAKKSKKEVDVFMSKFPLIQNDEEEEQKVMHWGDTIAK